MVEQKELPMSSDNGEDPYIAVPSQTQPEANGKPWNTTVSRQFASIVTCGKEAAGEGRGGGWGAGRMYVIEIYCCITASS